MPKFIITIETSDEPLSDGHVTECRSTGRHSHITVDLRAIDSTKVNPMFVILHECAHAITNGLDPRHEAAAADRERIYNMALDRVITDMLIPSRTGVNRDGNQ